MISPSKSIFGAEKMAKIPVLVTFFNRPAILEKLFSAICENKEIEVFFAADGARNREDKNKIEACWNLVDKYFGQISDSHKLIRSQNYGCKMAMISNINWFFDLNDFGIILEDDCIPNPEFFKTVGTALIQTPRDSKYISISGSDYLPSNLNKNSGVFRESIFPQVWGWGSWANKWQYYKEDIPDSSEIVLSAATQLYGTEKSLRKMYFENIFNMRFKEVNTNIIDTWDYSLTATAWRHKFNTLQINGNAIVNSGFGEFATHTKSSAPSWVPVDYSSKKRDFSHAIDLDLEADSWIATNVYNCQLKEFVKNEIKKIVRI
jgi:hypothetical protein